MNKGSDERADKEGTNPRTKHEAQEQDNKAKLKPKIQAKSLIPTSREKLTAAIWCPLDRPASRQFHGTSGCGLGCLLASFLRFREGGGSSHLARWDDQSRPMEGRVPRERRIGQALVVPWVKENQCDVKETKGQKEFWQQPTEESEIAK